MRRDPVTVFLRALGIFSLFISVVAVAAIFIHKSTKTDPESENVEPGLNTSFSEFVEVGEIEGRKVYRFYLEDSTRCLVIFGASSSDMDCDWGLRR